MQILTYELQKWAKKVKKEIEADEGINSWYWPKCQDHEIFEQAYMKFVNGNLNPYYFESMIAAVKEPYKFNPALPEILKFCRYVRTLSPRHGKSPFGRMCVWKLPSGTQILTHRDDYKYHRFVTRNIFIVSENEVCKDVEIYIDQKPVDVKEALLFQFSPSGESHAFNNKSDKPFYFLGFDFWETPQLEVLQTMIDHDKIINDPLRFNGYGGDKNKYVSEH